MVFVLGHQNDVFFSLPVSVVVLVEVGSLSM